jgi:hypothetical protein
MAISSLAASKSASSTSGSVFKRFRFSVYTFQIIHLYLWFYLTTGKYLLMSNHVKSKK